MSEYIILLDPSLKDNQGNESINLGDVIIYESVSKYLKELFPDKDLLRISTHTFPEKKYFEILKKNNLKFFGGTNALSSDVRKYHQWKFNEKNFFFINPGVKNVILMGVGWWQYQSKPTITTKIFYNRVLSKKHFQSVRDEYTKNKVIGMGFAKTLNTSCPTTWELNGLDVNRKNIAIKNCLFMITDYKTEPVLDNELMKIILEYYSGEIYFFPQGTLDIEYINSLQFYKSNKNKIKILNRTVNEFKNCINRTDINFIGTRLHGGIKCLQNRLDSIIIGVDNRAKEMGKDINLPVVDRSDFTLLKKWLHGENVFSSILLPMEKIRKWKNQFINN
jgi:hypothetical protein